MRPATSGVGSAPHQLANVLARPLPGMLGAISDAYLRNTDDLMERIETDELIYKFLASLTLTIPPPPQTVFPRLLENA